MILKSAVTYFASDAIETKDARMVEKNMVACSAKDTANALRNVPEGHVIEY